MSGMRVAFVSVDFIVLMLRSELLASFLKLQVCDENAEAASIVLDIAMRTKRLIKVSLKFHSSTQSLHS